KGVVVGDTERVEQGGGGRIDAGVGAGNSEALLAQHSGQGRHGGSGDADDVNVLLLCGIGRCHGQTLGSRIFSVPCPSAVRRAGTPRGNVSMARAVCPMGAPKMTGMPRGARMRSATSRTEGLPATGGSHSGKSPRIMARTPWNLPA